MTLKNKLKFANDCLEFQNQNRNSPDKPIQMIQPQTLNAKTIWMPEFVKLIISVREFVDRW